MKRIRMIGMNHAVVTALNDFDPLKNLKLLSNELQKMKFRGKVVFDLFSINGETSNRFAKMNFDGKEFNRSTFRIIKTDINIKREQDQLFRASPKALSNSVLSSREIEEFVNYHS